jgi:uncharacterized SAM-binding protein YcdF (DUF218 family)
VARPRRREAVVCLLVSVPSQHEDPTSVTGADKSLRRWALLLTGSVSFCLLSSWVLWGDWPNPTPDELPARADVIVVLGGGAQERPRQAWKLLQEGRAEKVIVSGDGGIIVNHLLKLGTPQTALIHETEATSTLENARKTRPLLAGMKATTAVLVTTWSHARRAKRTFEREIPEVRFYSSFEPRPQKLNDWDKASQQTERYAALYFFFFRGLWCF